MFLIFIFNGSQNIHFQKTPWEQQQQHQKKILQKGTKKIAKLVVLSTWPRYEHA